MTNSTSNSNERIICMLAYLVFFLPLIIIPNSESGKFHANQGLLILILSIALSIIAVIPVLGWIIGLFGWILVVILIIMGMINANNMETKELPIIGKYIIIK